MITRSSVLNAQGPRHDRIHYPKVAAVSIVSSDPFSFFLFLSFLRFEPSKNEPAACHHEQESVRRQVRTKNASSNHQRISALPEFDTYPALEANRGKEGRNQQKAHRGRNEPKR